MPTIAKNMRQKMKFFGIWCFELQAENGWGNCSILSKSESKSVWINDEFDKNALFDMYLARYLPQKEVS